MRDGVALMVETASGTVYEFDDGLEHARRVPGDDAAALVGDDTWMRVSEVCIPMGHSMTLRLKTADGDPILRMTTDVVGIIGKSAVMN